MTEEKPAPSWRLRFGTMLSVLIVGSLLLSTGLLTFINYRLDSRSGKQVAERRFLDVAGRSASRLTQLERLGDQLALSLVGNPDAGRPMTSSGEHPFIANALRLLHSGDDIFSLFVGFPNGDYLEVSNLDAAVGLRQAWGAAPEDRWIVMSIRDSAEGRIESRAFLDADGKRRRVIKRESEYRANERPWFKRAGTGAPTTTDPYTLDIYPARGISHVARAEAGHVTGAIVLLPSVSELLETGLKDIAHYSALFDAAGGVVAISDTNSTAAGSDTPTDDSRFQALLSLAGAEAAATGLKETTISGVPYYTLLQPIEGLGDSPRKMFAGLAVAQDEILKEPRRRALLGAGVSMAATALVIPLLLLASGSLRRPIDRLSRNTRKIRERNYGELERVESHVAEVQWLSDSLMDMAQSIERYEAAQEELHNALVQLIAGAIDQKSAYTGGHCARVPVLALALAKAASDSPHPGLADFRFSTPEQWREFEIAAWLHDCGKITTPEHIVDKGSKLEALHNRIHEVRMRFEVLLRDAEIDFLRKTAADPAREPELRDELERQQRRIEDDFYFVAHCNVGGEAMSDQSLERLEGIARQQWERRLDSRVGLSPAEELHLEAFPVETPALEPLLADKPEHLVIDDRAADRYAGLNFTMHPPQFKQNLGELYNLRVRRGTLTEEDRYLINEHITATIKMLETLPWTEELARVPEYAGGHHEKLDGTGYPRSLDASQLSTPVRILAIADILEALTAGDRPYKRAKPMSAALRVLREMALTGHIDPQLFRLLIESGVYRAYAEQHLDVEQCDSVDEAELLRGFEEEAPAMERTVA